MRSALVALAAIAALSCDGGSRLPAPERGPVKAPGDLAVTGVEVVGPQKPEVVELYLRRAFARVVRLCRPGRGATVRVSVAIEKTGHITELGLRSSAPQIAVCARKHVENQRFPRVKGRTLASAAIEFLE